MAHFERGIIMLYLFTQIRNDLATVSSKLTPLKDTVYKPYGDSIDLVWKYNGSPEPDSIIFSRTNNEKTPLKGHVIGMWSAGRGFKPDRYNLSTNTRFELEEKDDGYELIKLVLINPCSKDYNMTYYCETNDKRYSSKVIVGLERPRIQSKFQRKRGNLEFIFDIMYSKKLVFLKFTRQLGSEQSTEEICNILFNETSIEDKFQHRIILNRKEINESEVFNVTMLNTTNQDSGEYFVEFVFQGGDNQKLVLNVTIDNTYSNKQHTAKGNLQVENTASITVSYYYTIILQCLFFLYLL